MARTDAHCPKCSEILVNPARCDECGWEKRGGGKAQPVEDMRCRFEVSGNRCFMPGTICGDTSGSPHTKQPQRSHYCAWHWQFVRGASPRYLGDRREFVAWLAARLERKQPWQQTIWRADPEDLWQRVTGQAAPMLSLPPVPDIRTVTGVFRDIRPGHLRDALESITAAAGVTYEPGSDEEVVEETADA